MIIRRIIGLLITAAILGIGYKVYSDRKPASYGNPVETIQSADKIKNQIQNQYGQ